MDIPAYLSRHLSGVVLGETSGNKGIALSLRYRCLSLEEKTWG